MNVLQATASGCKPLVNGRGERPCVSLMDRVLGDDALLGRLEAVVLSARWEPKDLPLLEATIARLAGKARHVIVLGPFPIYSSNLPRLLAQAETRGQEFVAAALAPEVRETDRLFAAALAEGPANYVSIHDLLCPGESCITRTPSGVPLQWDREHLTLDGAVTLAGRLEERGLFR
jgi:hypothetical protein